MEEWRNVIPYVWVSNLGNYRTEPRETSIYRDGKIIGHYTIKGKTVITEKGKYYQLTVDTKHWYLHQLVALAFPEICGEYFEGADVDHIIPISFGGGNEATNLHWVTRSENMRNPIRKGKLTDEEKKAHQRKYFQEHKEEYYERSRKSYVKGSRNEYLKQWRKEHPGYHKEYRAKKNYGFFSK